MSEPNSGITADVQGKNTTGNEVPRTPNSETSIASLSGNSMDALRSAHVTRTISTQNIRGGQNTNDSTTYSEPWMETVTAGKIDLFQKAIYNAVEKIVKQPEYINHPFAKKWRDLKKIPKTPMSSTIAWRSIKVILGIKDIFEYKAFLQQCPQLNKYIRIQPSVTTNRGFDWGIYEHRKNAVVNLMDDGINNTPSSTEVIIETLEPSPTDKDNQDLQQDVEAEPTPPPAQEQVLPPFTQLSDDTDESFVEIQPDVPGGNNPIVTPKKDNKTPQQMDETVPNPSDAAMNSNDDTFGFRSVHYRLFESVYVWLQQEGNSTSNFGMKWRKATFEGLTGLTPWERAAKIFKLQYMRDYVKLMNECPYIQARYEILFNYFDHTIRLKELTLPDDTAINADASKINDLYGKMKNMAFSFESTMKQISDRIDHINANLTGCERGIAEQLNRVADRIASKVSHHMKAINDYADTAVAKLGQQTRAITAGSTEDLQKLHTQMQQNSQLRVEATIRRLESQFEMRVEQAIQDRLTIKIQEMESQFEVRMEQVTKRMETYLAMQLDQATDKAVKEVNCTADEAVEDLHKQTEAQMQKICGQQAPKPHFTEAPIKPSKLFPNVDVDRLFKSSANTAKVPAEVAVETKTDNVEQGQPVGWSKYGPSTEGTNFNPNQADQYGQYNTQYNTGLPFVCHNDILKRVNVQYTSGLG
jgi:hypothetical protein